MYYLKVMKSGLNIRAEFLSLSIQRWYDTDSCLIYVFCLLTSGHVSYKFWKEDPLEARTSPMTRIYKLDFTESAHEEYNG